MKHRVRIGMNVFSVGAILLAMGASPVSAADLTTTLAPVTTTVTDTLAPVTKTAETITTPTTSTTSTTTTSPTSLPTSTTSPATSSLTNSVTNPVTNTTTNGTLPSTALINIRLTATADTVEAEGMITYKIVVQNLTDIPMTDLHVIDALPKEVQFVTATNAIFDANTQSVDWSINSLAGQSSVMFELQVQVKADVPEGTVITNIVNGQSPNPTGNLPSNPVLVTVGPKAHQPFIDGYPNGTFRPDHSISRAEMAKIVSKIKGLPSPSQYKSFSDLTTSHWAYQDIEKAVAAGIFSGYPDGHFYPDQALTRAEMTMVILKMNAISPNTASQSTGSSFSDVPSNYWAAKAIQTAVNMKYVNGYEDGTFRPEQGILRSEAVTMLDRLLGRGPLQDGKSQVIQHFSDVPRSYWGFGWIEEAAKQAHVGVHDVNGEKLDHYVQ